MYDVEFRVLGPVELLVRGSRVPLRGVKHHIILALLLTASHHRESIARLVEAVWSGCPPPTAVKQVRNAVSDLRRTLSGTLVSITPIADCYQLNLAEAAFDLHSFQRKAGAARSQLSLGWIGSAMREYRAALSLWTGPALSGLDAPVLCAVAAGLQEERLTVLEECIDLELRQGHHKVVVRELSQLATDNPLRERIAAQLIVALHRSGARDRAFAVYERTRRALASALGIDPGHELRELHRQMLREENAITRPPLPLVAPHVGLSNLPPRLLTFTGRARELATLFRSVGDVDGGVPAPQPGQTVVIDGMGGAGKTALAVEAAHRLADRYPDGQLFIDLYGHSVEHAPLTAKDGLRRLLRMSGFTAGNLPDAVEDLSALWRRQLVGRRVLLLLDNAASSHQVQPLVANGTGCLTVVTSRRHLTMLPSARVHSLDLLSPADARDLFGRLTADRRVRDELPWVDLILGYCGYLPLAIVLAAGKLRRRPTWPLSYFAGRLADIRRRLTELRTESQGLAECFDVSYRHLSEDHQRLLVLLSPIADRDIDAEAVAVLTALPVHRIEQMLDGLIDEHVLEQPEPGRYRLHGLLRIYCAEKATLLDAVVA